MPVQAGGGDTVAAPAGAAAPPKATTAPMTTAGRAVVTTWLCRCSDLCAGTSPSAPGRLGLGLPCRAAMPGWGVLATRSSSRSFLSYRLAQMSSHDQMAQSASVGDIRAAVTPAATRPPHLLEGRPRSRRPMRAGVYLRARPSSWRKWPSTAPLRPPRPHLPAARAIPPRT